MSSYSFSPIFTGRSYCSQRVASLLQTSPIFPSVAFPTVSLSQRPSFLEEPGGLFIPGWCDRPGGIWCSRRGESNRWSLKNRIVTRFLSNYKRKNQPFLTGFFLGADKRTWTSTELTPTRTWIMKTGRNTPCYQAVFWKKKEILRHLYDKYTSNRYFETVLYFVEFLAISLSSDII